MGKTLVTKEICSTFATFLKLKLLFYYLIYKKMKKLVLALAVIASMSLYACGSSEKAAEANDAEVVEEAATEVVEEAQPDSVAQGDTVAAAEVVVAE